MVAFLTPVEALLESFCEKRTNSQLKKLMSRVVSWLLAHFLDWLAWIGLLALGSKTVENKHT